MREWFRCLIEMKGNFYINAGFRNNRIFLQPIFSLTVKREDLDILEDLKKEVGVGEIKIGRRGAFFVIRGLKNLNKFLDVVNEDSFITSKKNDFLLWKEAIQLIKDFKHLTKEGFLRICEIRDKMNLKKKRKSYKNKKFFERLLEKFNVEFENEEKRKKISSSLRMTYSIRP
jgi:hypothetical protein